MLTVCLVSSCVFRSCIVLQAIFGVRAPVRSRCVLLNDPIDSVIDALDLFVSDYSDVPLLQTGRSNISLLSFLCRKESLLR